MLKLSIKTCFFNVNNLFMHITLIKDVKNAPNIGPYSIICNQLKLSKSCVKKHIQDNL